MKAKFTPDKFLVINNKKIEALPDRLFTMEEALMWLSTISPENNYLVVNQDEPYAKTILDIILMGEDAKNVQDGIR